MCSSDLTSNGYISGTSPAESSPTTFTFTIRATDAQQQDTDRSFSLTINPDVVTWSSPANNTTYTYNTGSAISNVTLSASASSGQGIVYTANALPTGLSLTGSNISGTPTVGGNSSTLLTATANVTGKSATDTINWVIYAGDTYFKYVSLLLSASNSPSATFVSDISTNNFALTVSGNTRPNNLNPYTPGYYSNYFNGSTDYLSIAANAAFNVGSGTYTVECWLYQVARNATAGGFFSLRNADDTSFPDLCINANGTIQGYMSGGAQGSASSGTVALNTWTHVAIVRSSGTLTYYINGTASGTSAQSNTWTANTPKVGGQGWASAYCFNGYISNLRFVNGIAVYTGNFTVPTSPLAATQSSGTNIAALTGTQTTLLTSQSNRYLDNSTNSWTVSTNGSPQISGFMPFTPNTSYSTYGSGYFDGSTMSLTVASNSA